jgi:REP element-mobilizing transposase RayT
MALPTSNPWRALINVAIDGAVAGHDDRLAAFVYMPEHVHLLV